GAETPPVLVGMRQKLHQFWWKWSRNPTKFGGQGSEFSIRTGGIAFSSRTDPQAALLQAFHFALQFSENTS
ncbi:hypothetical protein, partial [Ligilactobacillus sp.]|uniref:hypothetical protein n=1 Tax=Ligilactobacillus sp. TaxID=2767921 RepID=UPI002FE30BCA